MKKQCYFKQNGIKHADYKNLELLRKFLSPTGKIMAAKSTGVSRKYQRKVANAVKNARYLGLLPYIEA